MVNRWAKGSQNIKLFFFFFFFSPLSFFFLLTNTQIFLIGNKWDVRYLVYVVLNSFKHKRKELPSERPCCLLLVRLSSHFVEFVISTSCLGMCRSGVGCIGASFLYNYAPFLSQQHQCRHYYYNSYYYYYYTNSIFLLRQILIEIRSPFLKSCPMVLSIEK